MQRAAICLVAVLTLLAGCSGGVGGGSDATPTPAASPAETPEEVPDANTSTGHDDTPTAATRLAKPVLNQSRVVEGAYVTINTTIQNLDESATTQTVSVQVGEYDFGGKTVELRPNESKTVHLLTLNTSAVAADEQFVTVSTATDTSTTRLDVQPRDPLEKFVSDVRNRTLALQDSRIVGPDHVELAFQAPKDYTQVYRNGGAKPVPEAVALVMANRSSAPKRVTLLKAADTSYNPEFKSTLTKVRAEQYAAERLLPSEFRSYLFENATLRDTDREYDAGDYREDFVFPTGDRARRAYAKALAQRLNTSNFGNISVADYGLYNGTVDLPHTWETLDPNTSIYVEFQVPTKNPGLTYRGHHVNYRGLRVYETLYKWGNLTTERTEGHLPESVQIRLAYPNGTVFETYDLPTAVAQDAEKGGFSSKSGAYIHIAFTSLYDGDPEQ